MPFIRAGACWITSATLPASSAISVSRWATTWDDRLTTGDGSRLLVPVQQGRAGSGLPAQGFLDPAQGGGACRDFGVVDQPRHRWARHPGDACQIVLGQPEFESRLVDRAGQTRSASGS